MIVELAKKQQGDNLSFPECVKYVANLTSKTHMTTSSNVRKSNKTDDWDWLNKFKRKKIENKLKVFDENVLDVFLPYPHESWLEEGISAETLREFEVGYYIREERISIVHRDIDGNLVGIRGRSMLQEDIDNGKKYMPITVGNTQYSYPTMFNLYGLHKTQNAIRRFKKIGLWESEKSVYKSHDIYGEDNWTVALGGSNISRFHLQIMLNLGVSEVILFPDKEFSEVGSEQEDIYSKKILKDAQMLAPYFRVYVAWDKWNKLELKDSPIDKGQETLEFLLKNKFEVTSKDEVIG